MKIFLGADHGGFELKTAVSEHLIHRGYEVEDCGAAALDPADDFPQYAYAVTSKILGEEEDAARGILICTSGQGMSMAANRVAGIRAALAWNQAVAKESRDDNNANVLCLPSKSLDQEAAFGIIDVWLGTDFSGKDRYLRRNNQLDELYG